VRCYPDVELNKAGFQALLESNKELPAFRQIGNVDKEAHKVIPVELPFMAPDTANVLRFARKIAGMLFELQDGLGQ
jgi:hypothetical protein